MPRYIDAEKLEATFNPCMTGEDAYTAGQVLITIQTTPSEDVAPVVHAHWEYVKSIDYEWDYPWMCSECGSCSQWETDYCKDCGAKMDEEVEDA